MSDEKIADNFQEEVLEEEEEHELPKTGCGVLGKYPVVTVLSFALVGLGIGIGLSYWDPDDPDAKDKLLKWMGLIGDLFIRALKCVVLPLVFVNVIISVVDMMTVGKAGSIGWKTVGLYLATTVFASILGIITTLMVKGLYNEDTFDDSGPALVKLGCNEDGSFLTEAADGSVSCVANPDSEADSEFVIKDISSTFMKKSSGPASSISLSDTVYDGVFRKLVTANITESFASANFAAVVFFAIFFGVALSRLLEKQQKKGIEVNYIMMFLKEIDAVLLTIINWVIMLTPFAVLSLIIKAVGGREDLIDAFENVGYLVLATAMAMALQFFLVYVGTFALVTKSNPFTYLRHVVPAQTMAFACASSAATIPMTLKCVESSGRVPTPVARFVVPLGATVNMDGGAIYFPCACIWLAVLNGEDVNIGSYLLLVIISTIGSAGTAPVPSASLVLIITAYNTVFNTSGTPDGFEFILAIDWFMDRLRTTLNVTGDTIVSGMVAHLCPLEAEKVLPMMSEEQSAIEEAVPKKQVEESAIVST